MSTREKIEMILAENGISINKTGTLIDVDSISFISAIVSIEEEFDIEIPDEYLYIDALNNTESISGIVETELVSKNK